MKKKILVRVDYNAKVGLGHILRCQALSLMLINNFDITFYTQSLDQDMETTFSMLGLKIEQINNDFHFLSKLNSGNLAIVDGYNFTTDFQRLIKETGSLLICIDDLHDKEFYADLIINHAPSITQKEYFSKSYTKFALGPEYALLRPKFLRQARIYRKIDKIESVLICFGGSDYNLLTLKTLQSVILFKEFKKILVILGKFTLDNDFSTIVNTDSRVKIRRSVSEELMLESFLDCELAIVPSSGMLFEALASGCIVISGYHIKNQQDIYFGFLKNNSIIPVDNFSNIASVIKSTLAKKSYDFHKIIDGYSDSRINKLFLELVK